MCLADWPLVRSAFVPVAASRIKGRAVSVPVYMPSESASSRATMLDVSGAERGGRQAAGEREGEGGSGRERERRPSEKESPVVSHGL